MGKEWVCNETTDFIRSAEELGLSEDIKDAIKSWAISFRRQPTTRSGIYFRSPNTVFEIWVVRMGDPDSKKGKKGGFRLTCFLNLIEGSNNLCKIEQRDSMGFRKERPRAKQKHEDYLKALRKYLLKQLDS